MDPNAALAEIREITHKERYPSETDAHRLTDLVDALDGWMSNGGFPPDDWKPRQ